MKLASASAKDTPQKAEGAIRTQCNVTTSPILAELQDGYQPKSWVYDTGANRHLVGDKRYFVEFQNRTELERKKETVKGLHIKGYSVPCDLDARDGIPLR